MSLAFVCGYVVILTHTEQSRLKTWTIPPPPMAQCRMAESRASKAAFAPASIDMNWSER